jgi:hypothetical protein
VNRFLLGVLAMLLVLTGLPPATAQQTDATGTINLVSQTPFRSTGQPFNATLRMRTSSATAGLEIAVGTYRRLRSRSEFVNSVEGRLPTRTPTDLARFPVDSLVPDADGNVTVAIEPRATLDGVYPVRIELRDSDGDVVDGFTTFLISIPATVEADPLDVAVVLPLHAPPALTSAGEVDVDDTRANALTEVAAMLAQRGSIPMTLAPTPETLEALATSGSPADRETAAALATAASGRQVPAGTYVPTDLAAMLASGLDSEVNAQLARGARVVADAFDAPPDFTTRIVEEVLDDAALAALASQDVTGLVIAERSLDPIRLPNNLTLTATFGLGGAEGMTAAVADAGLAAHLTRDLPPALGASHLLADLAVLWLDLPGRSAARRGVVFMPNRSWTPDAALLDAFLEGLSTNPIFAPVTVAQFLEQVGPLRTRNTPTNRSFLPRDGGSAGAGAIRSTRRDLEAFAAIVSPDNPALDLLDRMLLVSQSSDVRPGTRTRYLRGVDNAITEQLSRIDMPDRRSITLTAREGELPITITSSLDYPVTVVLSLESDALDFPSGASRTLELTRQNTTERFPVHARGSGSFPVRVRVTAPQGGLIIAESRFTVRSTAVSGVGVALSVGAALFLIVWWASHLRSRRNERRDEPLPA